MTGALRKKGTTGGGWIRVEFIITVSSRLRYVKMEDLFSLMFHTRLKLTQNAESALYRKV